jgi:hypothetical protein
MPLTSPSTFLASLAAVFVEVTDADRKLPPGFFILSVTLFGIAGEI